jgi:hypothetical protein
MQKLIVFVVGLFLISNQVFAFYGVNATEAMLTYQAIADVKWSDKEISNLPQLETLNSESNRNHKKAIDLVESQIQHLMGTFQSASFKEEFGFPGVLGEQENYDSDDYKQTNYQIEFLKVEKGTSKGRLSIAYKFTGKSVFDLRAFKNSDRASVPLKLPLSPDLIYKQSMGKKGGEPFNYCTDPGYNDEGDFWYFWDPQQKKCPLADDNQKVLRITGELKLLPNSVERYPDYNALYGDNDNGKVLEISLLLGYVDDIPNNKIGHTKDTTYKNFKVITKELKDMGFTELTGKDHYKDNFKITSGGNETKGANFLREYASVIHTDDGRKVHVHVQVLLADTAIASRDNTFHYYLVPAFENADVLIYDGHSGLGGNLDLGSLPKVHFDLNKYQIFFFNGCSSYSYYNGMFFQAKHGSKNLDIVNSGLETSSDSTAPNALAFMKYIIRGDLKSYRRILTALEKSNGEDNGTYLTGVSGEDDNTYQP